ncbi:C6 transcription factor, partial [Fusarium oxysporum f. sp. phaseoli]
STIGISFRPLHSAADNAAQSSKAADKLFHERYHIRQRPSRNDIPARRLKSEQHPDLSSTAIVNCATMPTTQNGQFRIIKKCAKACKRCRSMKVKCSGAQPCLRCGRKNERCIYEAEEKKVSVPESYLRALERRQDGLPSPGSLGDGIRPRPRHSSVSDYGISGVVTRDASMVADGASDLTLGTPQDHDENDETNEAASLSTNDVLEPAFRQNPLVDNDYVFGQAMGRYWYMGPASSWAFCRRVLALVGKHLPEANNEPLPWHLDGVAFRLQWRPLMPDEPPDISNLPPSDYAYFLIQTARFYLGPLASLIDEAEFLQHFKELYQDASAKAASCKLWYAQYLLMIAFGKAFLGGKSADGSPPGYQYAARAMPLMPELAGIALDPVLSAQALTLAAIYFQSIDMRVAAYQHIGQALRICVLSGFHRHMPEEAVGEQHSKRCHIIFWVVYMLDQEFAALIGATSAIRDEDITNKLPSQADSSLSSLSLTLHVQLARLIARLLGTVYGVGKDYDGTLFSNTQSILRNLAELNRDLNNIINNHFRDSISKASRIATRLLLQYHHCVVLTTRPQIMCALHMHIEQSKTQLMTHGLSLSPPVASLIQSCVSSAQAILKTLRALADEDLIEAFLPFQIEYASSSAFLLHLIPIICPSLLSDESWRDDARYVFDTLIAKGSLIAPLRKVELEQLEQKLSALTPASNIVTPEIQTQVEEHGNVQEEENREPELQEHVSDETGWDLFAANAMAGLTPGELLDLAEQLDVDSFLYQPEM